MKTTISAIAAAVLVLAVPASGQSLADKLKGTWQGEFAPCGQLTMVVTGVDAKTGGVSGTYDCPRMGKAAMGAELIKGKQLSVVLQGNEVHLKGSSSYMDFTFDGTTLTGVGGPNGMPGLPVTLTR